MFATDGGYVAWHKGRIPSYFGVVHSTHHSLFADQKVQNIRCETWRRWRWTPGVSWHHMALRMYERADGLSRICTSTLLEKNDINTRCFYSDASLLTSFPTFSLNSHICCLVFQSPRAKASPNRLLVRATTQGPYRLTSAWRAR